MFCSILKEFYEEFLHLSYRTEPHQLFDVDPARSDEGGVKTVRIVGGQEGQPRLTGHHSIQSIEKTSQGHLRLASIGGPGKYVSWNFKEKNLIHFWKIHNIIYVKAIDRQNI